HTGYHYNFGGRRLPQRRIVFSCIIAVCFERLIDYAHRIPLIARAVALAPAFVPTTTGGWEPSGLSCKRREPGGRRRLHQENHDGVARAARPPPRPPPNRSTMFAALCPRSTPRRKRIKSVSSSRHPRKPATLHFFLRS